jgi:hypothetical protein
MWENVVIADVFPPSPAGATPPHWPTAGLRRFVEAGTG